MCIFNQSGYICIYTLGSACGMMVIMVGNRHGETSSNPQ